jgi:amidase
MASWQERAADKRAQLQASIPSAWLLPASTLAAPPSDVRSIPRSSGILTQLELQITEEDDAGMILYKICSREWSSEQVTLAFCKRAAIAQQLVSPQPPLR